MKYLGPIQQIVHEQQKQESHINRKKNDRIRLVKKDNTLVLAQQDTEHGHTKNFQLTFHTL